MTWGSKVGQEIADKLDNKERSRQEAIYELVETEKSYTDDMTMIMDRIAVPLVQKQILSQHVVNNLFRNLGHLITISKAMVAQFNKLPDESGIIHKIGHTLIPSVSHTLYHNRD